MGKYFKYSKSFVIWDLDISFLPISVKRITLSVPSVISVINDVLGSVFPLETSM